jgi:hypothetical protein
MLVSMSLIWSKYTYDNTGYHIESFYGPICIPSGIYTTCNDVPQTRIVPDASTTSGQSTGAETPARFACVALACAVWWGRNRWTRKLARSIVTSGAVFVVWQTYGAVLQTGVVAFIGALVVVWLSQPTIASDRDDGSLPDVVPRLLVET